MRIKSTGTAYLLWFVSFFGLLGFQHFYLRKPGKGIIWILTGGVFGLGALIDLFTLGSQVDNFNTRQEMKELHRMQMTTLVSTTAATAVAATATAATAATVANHQLNATKQQ